MVVFSSVGELNQICLLLRDYGSHSMQKIKIQVNYYLRWVSLAASDITAQTTKS